MIKHLTISNYALIDQLEIDWHDGLSIITGETGSGKSILLGALSLILGQRADTTALRDKNKKCVIEGEFDIRTYKLKPFFEELNLDYEEMAILRREISTSGKSRAFINDTPVNLSDLKLIGDQLVDIHSQHQTLLLNNKTFQYQLCDAYAGTTKLAQEYQENFRDFQLEIKQLEELKKQENAGQADLDYVRFQLEELEVANLKQGELEKLEEQASLLNNSELIQQKLAEALSVLQNEEQSVLSMLTDAKGTLSSLASIDTVFGELNDRINSTFIELQDLSRDIEQRLETLDNDPQEAERINDRIGLIYQLQQKHRINTVEELINLKQQFSDQLNGIGSLEEKIKALEKKVELHQNELFKKGEEISAKRKHSVSGLEERIALYLKELAMENARFKIEIHSTNELTKFGIDEIRFLFSANKGSELADVSKVASGGELSRLMLSIKAILAESISLPTIVFDEIDTGVSGEIANKIGDILKRISKDIQLISITHLPQLAAKGKTHYKVFKEDRGEVTNTHIIELKQEERVTELAKMLSGEKLSEAAIMNARELLLN